MNAYSLHTAASHLKEKAFKRAVAPLVEGRQRLVQNATPTFTLDEETLQLVARYTPAVQNLLDYYDVQIDKVRQRYYGRTVAWTFARPAARPQPQL